MKTTLTILFLSISLFSNGQNTDVLYVPKQNTLVASYNGPGLVGFYIGGYFKSSFPQPYIYTTPLSFLNRVGLNLIDNKNRVSFMGGTRIENFVDSVSFKPDLWLKIYPLRTLLKTSKGPDFVIALNYSEKFYFGIGLSIGVRGIYR
jgi:hypothetical protein